MPKDEDNAFAAPCHHDKPHADKRATDALPMQLRLYAHGAKPHGGGLPVNQNAEKLDMTYDLFLTVRHQGQKRSLICMQAPDDGGFFGPLESSDVQGSDRIQIFR